MERTGTVRPMRAEDLERVAQLEQMCFSESWSENMLRSGLDNRLDSYLVYQEAETVLGYCVLRTLADEGEIQRIAVDPAFRRQGIARKLMESMAAVARMKGAREVALEVRESNESARKLYESYGFRQEAVRRGYYRNPPEDAIIMWNRGI
ncbi:MAG: ribosomal protein S18-alanine N-acetyltransferase [Enterocloster asparagiformis]|nr:ribosomal protein S18-alanine N-acetyltransferase [Enterocloster asparagiformis]